MRSTIEPFLMFDIIRKVAADADRFIVSVARREEKGSDVNVAAHLLWDVLRG
jgi:hypothetical protein